MEKMDVKIWDEPCPRPWGPGHIGCFGIAMIGKSRGETVLTFSRSALKLDGDIDKNSEVSNFDEFPMTLPCRGLFLPLRSKVEIQNDRFFLAIRFPRLLSSTIP